MAILNSLVITGGAVVLVVLLSSAAGYTITRFKGRFNKRFAPVHDDPNALPFAVFLYTNFIKLMPREIEESAIIDGCTWFSAF